MDNTIKETFEGKKKTDNHELSEIDRLVKPATSTMIDRYVFANHWTKDKTVIDAATGKGYGAGILLALGGFIFFSFHIYHMWKIMTIFRKSTFLTCIMTIYNNNFA